MHERQHVIERIVGCAEQRGDSLTQQRPVSMQSRVNLKQGSSTAALDLRIAHVLDHEKRPWVAEDLLPPRGNLRLTMDEIVWLQAEACYTGRACDD